MLQPQKSKLLGDLYYNETPREYVAPPIRERKALNARKEEDYILTRNMQNELDKIKRTLPYLPQSSPVYNNLVGKLDKAMSGITPDNYEDNVLNVEQVANDFYNKWGGNELVNEYSQMQTAKQTYEDAYNKGELKDRGMVDWFKQRVSKQGGLTIDANGVVSRPSITSIPYAKDRNPEKELDELFKGWEKDGSIVRDSSGNIKVTKSIPGYLSTSENEYISEQELFDAGMRVLNNDGGMQAYLKQKAEYDTKDMPANAETLNAILKPNQKQMLFGNSNATAQDIQTAISEGKINPQEVLTNQYKTELQIDSAMFPVAKYGFNREKLNTLKDELLLESLKQTQKNMESSDDEMSNVSVTIQPFTAQSVLNPTDVENIKTIKSGLSTQRATLQAKINQYSKAVSSGQTGYTQDQLDLLNAEQTKLDADIADLTYQEQQVNKIMRDNFKKAGIDIKQQYKENNTDNVERAVEKNIDLLVNKLVGSADPSVTVDVSDIIKVIDKNGKAIMYSNKNGEVRLPIVDSIPKDKFRSYVLRNGNQYTLLPGRLGEDEVRGILTQNDDLLFTDNGSLGSSFRFRDNKERNNFYKAPNEEEYIGLAVEAYNKGVSGTNLLGIDKPEYVSGNFVTNGKLLKGVDAVKTKIGDFQYNVAEPLTYIMVQGETSKSNLVALTNDRKALNESFKKTPEQYTIMTPTGEMNLSDYLREELDIPSIDSKYIDWDKSSIETTSQTDRKYGQKYGISIVLTEDGKKELDDEDETYSRTNAIKLVGVNKNKNVPAEQARIQNLLLKAYADVTPDSTSHGVNMKKEMGKLYFNNSPYGSNMDKFNLYTLSAGAEKPINIAGTEYMIQTSAKDANDSDLMNVNFHLSKIANGQKVVLAINDAGQSAWKTLQEVEGKDWSRVTFETPDDIKSIIGATLLDNTYKSNKNSLSGKSNVYAEYLKGSNYQSVGNDTIQATNYNKILKNTKSYYGSGDFVSRVVNNRNGKTENIKTNIPETDLYDLRISYPNNIASTNSYPYVNKAIATKVEKVLNDYNVIATGGFRGQVTHFGLKGSGEDSLHKYAGALDFRADKNGLAFYEQVATNPELLKQLGIAKIMKHNVDGVLHIHTEFIP